MITNHIHDLGFAMLGKFFTAMGCSAGIIGLAVTDPIAIGKQTETLTAMGILGAGMFLAIVALIWQTKSKELIQKEFRETILADAIELRRLVSATIEAVTKDTEQRVLQSKSIDELKEINRDTAEALRGVTAVIEYCKRQHEQTQKRLA